MPVAGARVAPTKVQAVDLEDWRNAMKLHSPRTDTGEVAPEQRVRTGPKHLRRPPPKVAAQDRRGRRRRWMRRIGIGLVVVVVAATPIWVSFGRALTDPSLGPSVPARAAEWTRDHGGASFVAWVENLWYSHHGPKVGGAPPKGEIPGAVHLQQVSGANVLATPRPLKPLARPPIAGEGDWHPIGRSVDGVPAMYETFLRPDPVHTSVVVGVVWMDTKLLSFQLYSGSYIPGGGPYRHTAPIAPAAAKRLVAAFNSGFRTQDAQGGYFTEGHDVVPLRNGAASMVIYKNGSANIVAWHGGPKVTDPKIASVRQNLALLVSHGKAVAGLNPNDISKWGFTLGNQVYVWRSGIGITAKGALVYVGGPGLNITTLAKLLVRAGAVRAMELDINDAWVNFTSFKPHKATGLASAANGTNLLSSMVYPPAHYFESWWARDFFTASAR